MLRYTSITRARGSANSGASAREARSDAPYLRKIGKPSSRDLVMTSAYERESERASERANAVRTDSGGGGGASCDKAHGDLRNALGGNCQKRLICICYVDKRSGR